MKLTDESVRQIAPADQPGDGKNEVIVFDDDLPGFGIRCRAGGGRTWIVQYRDRGRQRRTSLGRVDEISAAVAREKARAILPGVASDDGAPASPEPHEPGRRIMAPARGDRPDWPPGAPAGPWPPVPHGARVFVRDGVARIVPGHEVVGGGVGRRLVLQPASTRRRGGRPTAYDWDSFWCEVVRVANLPDGLPEKQSQLEARMLEWCQRAWGREPGTSTIRQKLSLLYAGERPIGVARPPRPDADRRRVLKPGSSY